MWDKDGATWDGMPASAPAPLEEAVKVYRRTFNVPPPLSEFIDDLPALTREIVAAVRRGERLTSAELHCRLGR
ncbi:hypothetical protein [Muricoccus nepalensis]|nr:hypothetical protein [Roseomonas nepalensis]